MHKLTEQIYKVFSENKNAEDALKMKKYMRDQFDYFGLRAPQMKEAFKKIKEQVKQVDQAELDQVLYELMDLPERELQIAALYIMDVKLKKPLEEDILLIEKLVITKSWWDTVDHIAINHGGIYFKHFPSKIESVIEKWMASGNMWLQRSAILFQLKYKTDTNVELLFDLIKRVADSKEFFIQKGIGWALREYSKTEPLRVLQFIQTNQLAPLSKREGLKHIQKQGLHM